MEQGYFYGGIVVARRNPEINFKLILSSLMNEKCPAADFNETEM